MRGRAIATAFLAGAMLACSSAPRRPLAGREGHDTTVAPRDIDAVLAAHTDSLLAIPGVVGTAVGLCGGERCIKVLVANSKTAAMQRIPTQLEGYRVVVDVTGPIRPR
jgi:hypothetical protein